MMTGELKKYILSIPTLKGIKNVEVSPGSSTIFVGANGGGKTRLAVNFEATHGLLAHRISAHRILNLNPSVAKITEEKARAQMNFGSINNPGTPELSKRNIGRWKQHAATTPLNDFDALLQILYAEQAKIALQSHRLRKLSSAEAFQETKFEILSRTWEKVLPHRILDIGADDILVSSTYGKQYSASEMSDGERAIFYLVGQILIVPNESIVIIDEPELHIHRSIMASLWDELEQLRPDCAFVFITHDLEFAATRSGRKFVIRDYDGQKWTIEDVPEDTGFGEELTTLILGSRRPILFVEGTKDSLDYSIYRHCYPNWTVVPRGSCEDVKHSVITLRKNAALTRVNCAGIIDGDGYSTDEVSAFDSFGIKVLPVSEIENIFLESSVAKAILEHEGHDPTECSKKIGDLEAEIFALVGSGDEKKRCAVRYCLRRIDRILKRIDFQGAHDIPALVSSYSEKTSALDVDALAKEFETKIDAAISAQNLDGLLAIYDNKGMLAIAARHLRAAKADSFKEWLVRNMAADRAPAIKSAIQSLLPKIEIEANDKTDTREEQAAQ